MSSSPESIAGWADSEFIRISGGGDTMNTIIVEGEFDSLAAFEAHPQKMGADPEMRALLPKYEGVIESMEVEFYMPMP